MVQLVVHFWLQCTSGCSLPGFGTTTDSKVDDATIAVYPSCLLKFSFAWSSSSYGDRFHPPTSSMWWFALRWTFAELPLLLRISLAVCPLWENFTNYFIVTASHVLSRLKVDSIILKQRCYFTQVFAIDCDVMHTKWWRQIYPCSTKSAMGADDVINVQRCYPCSTRSAMGFDDVIKVLKTPRPVIIVAEQVIHWKRITPFPSMAIGVLNLTLVCFNDFCSNVWRQRRSNKWCS